MPLSVLETSKRVSVIVGRYCGSLTAGTIENYPIYLNKYPLLNFARGAYLKVERDKKTVSFKLPLNFGCTGAAVLI